MYMYMCWYVSYLLTFRVSDQGLGTEDETSLSLCTHVSMRQSLPINMYIYIYIYIFVLIYTHVYV